MAYPLIQGTASASTTADTTLSLAFGSNNTQSNAIVVAVVWTGSVTCSVSDSQGNSYSSTDSAFNLSGTVFQQIFYALNIKSGANTVTMTTSGTSTFRSIFIHEFSMIGPVSSLDAHDSGKSNVGTDASSNSITTTGVEDVLFTWGFCSSSITSINNSWVQDVLYNGNMTGHIVKKASTYNSDFTTDSAGAITGVVIASFNTLPSESAFGPPTNQPYLDKPEIIGY